MNYTLTINGSIDFNTGKLTMAHVESYKLADAVGWDKIAQKTEHTDYVAPNLNAVANFETRVCPAVALLLYGIAGPKINVTGFAKTEAALVTATQNWNLDLVAGAQTQVGK